MKKILLILIVLIPLGLYAQDKYAYELPEYTVVANDSTDVLYIDDSGIDKHIEMPTFIDMVHDSTAAVRGELADSAAALRGEIAGGGGWTKVGSSIYPTLTADNVGIGTSTVTSKLTVSGNISASGVLYGASLAIGTSNSYTIAGASGDMTFWTPNASMVFDESYYTTGAEEYFGRLNVAGIRLTPSNDAPVSPAEGDIRWLNSANAPQYYSGTAWTDFGGSLTSHITDSLFLDYLGGGDVFLTLTTTNAIDTGTLVNAGFMLSLSPFPSVDEYFKDMQNGELKWYYIDKKTKTLKSQYGLTGLGPLNSTNALMGGIERSYRWIHELSEKNEVLERELRKTQAELDTLKKSYEFRIQNIEATLNEVKK